MRLFRRTSAALADKNFALLKSDLRHPSLHFKRIGQLWSVRVGGRYRALGTDVEDGISWFWIGTHAEYDETGLREGLHGAGIM